MENKISKEHLDRLQEIQRNTSSVKIQIAETTVNMSELESRKNHLISIHNDLAKQEEEFGNEIRKTYGEVKSINFQTGEFEL